MNKLFTLSLLLLATLSSFSQTLVNQTATTSGFDTPSPGYSYVKAVPIPGGLAVLYNYFSTGAAQENYYLAKMDSDNNIIAGLSYNSLHNGRDFGTNIYAKGSYLYAVGFTTDPATSQSLTFNTLKINIDTWDTAWSLSENIDSGLFELPVSVLADDNGNVYVGGTVQSPTGNLMAVVKYDSTGRRLWSGGYDTAGFYTAAVAMALPPGKPLLGVTGFSFDGTGHSHFTTARFTSQDGVLYDTKTTSSTTGAISHPVNIAVDSFNNSYVAGTSTVSGSSSVIKMVSYDTAFNQNWALTYGDSSLRTTASAMVVDYPGPGHNIYITGSTIGPAGQSLVLLRYTTAGALCWAKTITAANLAYGTNGLYLILDPTNNYIYVTGTQYNGTDTDIITAAYDTAGNQLWSKTYDSGGDDIPYSITIDEKSNVFVTGKSAGAGSKYVMLEYQQWRPGPCVLPARLASAGCPAITYAFKNEYIDTAASLLNFDIYAKQNIPAFGYAGGNIILTYNNSAFGHSIAGHSNITVSTGTITADRNAYSIAVSDTLYDSDAVPANGGEVMISIASIDSNQFNIADTFQQLCHVKMRMQHVGDYQVGFDQFFMQGGSEYNNDVEVYSFVGAVGYLRSNCPNYTLTYTIENQKCVAGNKYSFDVTVHGPSNGSVPIYDLGFTVSWNSALSYVSNTTIGVVGGSYCDSSTDQIFDVSVSGADNPGLGTTYFNVQAVPFGTYYPSDGCTPNLPYNSTLLTTITLSYTPPLNSTGLGFAMTFTDANNGITAPQNDYYCFSGNAATRYNVTTNVTRALHDECGDNGIALLNNSAGIARVYPNPFSDVINLQYATQESEDVTFDIVDLLGRSIYKEKQINIIPGFHTKSINISESVPTGIYLLIVHKGNNNATTLKIIKE